MSQAHIQDYEHIASHISEYIDEGNFFDVFEIEDIKKIMKISNFTANGFIALLEQSHPTINANKLYACTRNANIYIQNFEDVISTLKSIKKYMKLRILNSIVDFLDSKGKEIYDSTEKIQKLQTELNEIPKQKSDNEIQSLQSQLNQINEESNKLKEKLNEMESNTNQADETILSKIKELKESDDFESIYNFLDELSSQGNRKMISKACEEGLWKKTTTVHFRDDGDEFDERNVLHVASNKGNLKLVKSLIECGCDKGTKSSRGLTPLNYASWHGHLEVVKYLISNGADKEAKDNAGSTPLIYASSNGHLEVVKYLISVGADKEAKNNDGWTPLIWASRNGHLEVVKYLISV
ncbi:ankyrin repeat protein, putative, partial [Trichomonas vaginalis G3]